MIKNIFIPEDINGYVVLAQKVLGINIHKSYIQGTLINLNKRSATVEKFHTQPIENNSERTYDERVEIALKAIIDSIGHYDKLRTSLSSSHVMFKELTVPFTEYEKIAQIIPFELEPHLPFGLHEGVVDFVITHIDKQAQTATVMTAAVRKEVIAQHLARFEALGIKTDAITVDMFDIVGLYQQTHSLDEQESYVLINGNYEQTQIALISKGRLVSIRSLHHGLTHVAKNIAKTQNIDSQHALEELVRFGVENPNDAAYSNAARLALDEYWKTISFTLQAWGAQYLPGKSITSLLLVGPLVEITGIPDYFKKISSLECAILTTQNFSDHAIFVKNKQSVPVEYIPSLATALPTQLTRNFNLRTGQFAPSRVALVNKQLFTGITLAIATLVALFLSGSWYIKKLNKSIVNSQVEVLEYLEDTGLSTEAGTLEEGVEQAETKVAQEEAVWFAFSNQTRFSFLKNLEQLSSAIDREGIGLELKKLAMTSHSITLDGSVRDFQALKTLERELKKSDLFVSVPTLQETSFNNLKLLLKKQNGARR